MITITLSVYGGTPLCEVDYLLSCRDVWELFMQSWHILCRHYFQNHFKILISIYQSTFLPQATLSFVEDLNPQDFGLCPPDWYVRITILLCSAIAPLILQEIC